MFLWGSLVDCEVFVVIVFVGGVGVVEYEVGVEVLVLEVDYGVVDQWQVFGVDYYGYIVDVE